jgi:hypothetical protein
LRRAFAVVALLALGACTTGTRLATGGFNDTVAVATDPPGAACELSRGGAVIATVNPTPGSASPSKSHLDVTVVCRLAGYQDATGVIASRFTGTTAVIGRILDASVVGLAADAGTGVNYTYASSINLTLTPSPEGTPPAASTGAPAAQDSGVPPM